MNEGIKKMRHTKEHNAFVEKKNQEHEPSKKIIEKSLKVFATWSYAFPDLVIVDVCIEIEPFVRHELLGYFQLSLVSRMLFCKQKEK